MATLSLVSFDMLIFLTSIFFVGRQHNDIAKIQEAIAPGEAKILKVIKIVVKLNCFLFFCRDIIILKAIN